MKIPFSPPDIGQEEINAVVKTMESSWITTGPQTEKLSQMIAARCHTEYAACMNSATACLEMALRLLGISNGDEVIVPAYTYTASASVIDHVGAKPVIVDIEPGTFHIDYDEVGRAVTEKTKAVIPVDLGGLMCDYDKLHEIAESKRGMFHANSELQDAFGRIVITADGAHSLLAQRDDGKCSGELADFTSFSLHAVKNITTAEGGALTWRSIAGHDGAAIKKTLMLLACHGQDRAFKPDGEKPFWEYDVEFLGYKHNMTDILASIGVVQLERADQIMEKRRSIFKRYDEAFKNMGGIRTLDHFTPLGSSCHLYMINLVGRDEIARNTFMDKMMESGVATNVHYKPLPLHTAYKKLGFDISDYPNAYNMYSTEVTLPSYSKMTDDEVEYVIKCVKQVYNEMGL
ncbi:MAG: DegT/DnrJ/EryC1/StrS aminotransferase family protein [Clostridia bacterium]|nr:DegT/DnrJ/EryC1/StrS aminotransferase family protein [Clostridia bacterium]